MSGPEIVHPEELVPVLEEDDKDFDHEYWHEIASLGDDNRVVVMKTKASWRRQSDRRVLLL